MIVHEVGDGLKQRKRRSKKPAGFEAERCEGEFASWCAGVTAASMEYRAARDGCCSVVLEPAFATAVRAMGGGEKRAERMGSVCAPDLKSEARRLTGFVGESKVEVQWDGFLLASRIAVTLTVSCVVCVCVRWGEKILCVCGCGVVGRGE